MLSLRDAKDGGGEIGAGSSMCVHVCHDPREPRISQNLQHYFLLERPAGFDVSINPVQGKQTLEGGRATVAATTLLPAGRPAPADMLFFAPAVSYQGLLCRVSNQLILGSSHNRTPT